MRLHFLHIGKTGGTAIKQALRDARFAFWRPDRAAAAPPTPFGRIQLHHHDFHLDDVPPDDYVFFCVRDPLARFVSAFYSRLNKGQPRYYFEWSEREREAFETFPTPERLGAALASEDPDERARARSAMTSIRHARATERALGSRRLIWARRRQIVYIARQETLGCDWEQLKLLLGLPAQAALPSGATAAHRRDPSQGAELDAAAAAALRGWYRNEYKLVWYCDKLREWHGWGVDPREQGPFRRLGHEARRLKGLPAVVPPPPQAIRRRVPVR